MIRPKPNEDTEECGRCGCYNTVNTAYRHHRVNLGLDVVESGFATAVCPLHVPVYRSEGYTVWEHSGE